VAVPLLAFPFPFRRTKESARRINVIAAMTHIGIGTIRKRATEICIGLQSLGLPAFVTLQVVDAAVHKNSIRIRMWAKWELITAVKHFRDRRGLKSGRFEERTHFCLSADVNDTNAGSVIKLYTQAYPPRDDLELLKSWAGLHWRKGDASRKLPPLQRDHVLLTSDRTATATAIRDEL
jgi:hypothetical protein